MIDNEALGWSMNREEVQLRELLDDESPFMFNAQIESRKFTEQQAPSFIGHQRAPEVNNAFITTHEPAPPASHTRLALLQRNLDPIRENRFTINLKNCDNIAVANDGYKWRKYGQKSIKNSPYPRSYYRCTDRRCSAKKQVERSREDEDTLIITYEGFHLHYSYPCLLLFQPPNPPIKKQKITSPAALDFQDFNSLIQQDKEFQMERTNLGLLEDVVPYKILNPLSKFTVKNQKVQFASSSFPSS